MSSRFFSGFLRAISLSFLSFSNLFALKSTLLFVDHENGFHLQYSFFFAWKQFHSITHLHLPFPAFFAALLPFLFQFRLLISQKSCRKSYERPYRRVLNWIQVLDVPPSMSSFYFQHIYSVEVHNQVNCQEE